MFNQFLEQRFGLSIWKVRRLAHLLFLAFSMMVYNIIAITIANSLFLNQAGAKSLPLFYVLIGLASIPSYALFSQIVDRYERTRLLRYFLLLAIALAVGMRLLINLNSVAVYYIIFLITFFEWDLQNHILFPSLLVDYLSSLEYKRYASLIAMVQGIGILIGGGLTSLLSVYLRPRDILLVLPVMFAIVIGQLLYLERSERPLDSITSDTSVGIIEALKTFPELVKRYKIIFFLAFSSFLLVIICIITEFLCMSIYSEAFPSDKELTSFLGLLRSGNSIIQLVVLYCFTQPLLQRLGVARMNLVYPLITLASFVGLVFNFSLKPAIVTNVNTDALYKAIHQPIYTLNYNAVPYEFVGRVRSLSDGFFYAFGLTLAGVLLWVSQSFLTLPQILWIAIGLTVILLIFRILISNSYVPCLEMVLRSDAVNLDELSESLTQLPPQSSSVVHELLESDEYYTRLKALELAVGLGNPSQFLMPVQTFFLEADSSLRQAAVKLFSTKPDAETTYHFEQLLDSENSTMRAIALEVLIASQKFPTQEQIRSRLGDVSQEVRALASVAATQTGAITNPQVKTTCEQLWHSELDTISGEAIVRVVSYSSNPELIPLLKEVLVHSTPEVKQEGLKTLAILARPGDKSLAEIATAELEHPEPLVRAAAFNLLGIARSQGMLRYVAIGLGDFNAQVRRQAAMALAAYGEQGLALAQDSLSSSNPDLVDAAIAAIGQVRIKRASDILFDYLTPDFQQVARSRQWQQQIPHSEPSWQPLAIAIADYHQRLIQKVLYVLSCLGNSRTVNSVKRLLYSKDQREVANAVETLASLRHKRFVRPLMPILEQLANGEQPANIRTTNQWMRTKGYKLLLEALESKDRWIKIGALIALAAVPSDLMKDPDPLVKAVAQQIFLPLDQHPSQKDFFMSRLLLLKNVSLFKNLSLDELLLIDQALEQEYVPAGETVFNEGNWGGHLYIIGEGSVRLIKEIDGEQQDLNYLSAGQHFGEIALFDDAPRWNGAVAVENCTLLKLEKNRFISLITQRPQIVLEICRFFSQRLRETDKYRLSRRLLSSSEVTKNFSSVSSQSHHQSSTTPTI
ncbi:MAG: cyclic nucleotide-binding domain-containing protein [Symploca sp. SIO2G7]|nr:cyclic nucleotide-binding domain-containing protein [Symploca sp. SIO2G7]